MDSVHGDWGLLSRVSPFRNLRVKWIFAPNRSLSQLITSFIGSQCQGIHSMLFLTWPFKSSTLALKSFLFTMLILSVNSGFSQQIDFWNRYPYCCLLPGDRLVLDSLSICLLLVFRYYSVFKVQLYSIFSSLALPSRKILCKDYFAYLIS